MRAVVMRSHGGPEVLVPEEVARPVPVLTEVLVRVRAAGVNPVDAFVRSGAFPLVKPPGVLGWDVSGVVEEVVPGVTRFRPGDEVFGMPMFPRPAGACAEYVVAPARQLARRPAGLDHVHGAALPLAGLTAWQMLVGSATWTSPSTSSPGSTVPARSGSSGRAGSWLPSIGPTRASPRSPARRGGASRASRWSQTASASSGSRRWSTGVCSGSTCPRRSPSRRRAHALLAERGRAGKIVLTV